MRAIRAADDADADFIIVIRRARRMTPPAPPLVLLISY